MNSRRVREPETDRRRGISTGRPRAILNNILVPVHRDSLRKSNRHAGCSARSGSIRRTDRSIWYYSDYSVVDYLCLRLFLLNIYIYNIYMRAVSHYLCSLHLTSTGDVNPSGEISVFCRRTNGGFQVDKGTGYRFIGFSSNRFLPFPPPRVEAAVVMAVARTSRVFSCRVFQARTLPFLDLVSPVFRYL